MPLTFTKKKASPRQHITSVTDVIAFGKHKDILVEDILHDEPGYFDWLLEKEIITVTDEMKRTIEDAVLDHMDKSIKRNEWARRIEEEDIGFMDDCMSIY